jgi:hypothetical protein
LYERAKEKPGWLSRLGATLSDSDLSYVEWLADCQTETDKRLREWDEEIDREGGPEIYNAETPEARIDVLSRQIAEIETAYADHASSGGPYFARAILLVAAGYDRLCCLRSKWQASLWVERHPERQGVISDADIQTAREYPLENLVELDRTKRMLCPFHKDEHPSLWVKNGFGYCFTCGESCDSIKFVMKTRGLSFIDAVRSLSGKG